MIFGDMQFTICWFLFQVQWAPLKGIYQSSLCFFTLINFRTSLIFIAFFNPLKDLYGEGMCTPANNRILTSVYNVLALVLACLPSWWRFLQCLRRYKDTSIVRSDFEGNEPLHTKCFGQKNKPSELDVIECLIDCHAKLTVANRQGFMPIHQAAMQGRIDVIALLLKKDTKKMITRALSSESYSSTYR